MPERANRLFYTSGRFYKEANSTFEWDGKLTGGRGTSGPIHLSEVLSLAIGLKRYKFDGSPELLNTSAEGDWVVRKGAARAELLKALEQILRAELGQPIRFEQREVEREVIVARGRFESHPLAGEKKSVVHLGTETTPSSEGGGSAGTLREMFDWLGDRIGKVVVDETESPAGLRLSWNDHLAEHLAEITERTEAGIAKLDRVLSNLSKQTALEFKRERRKVSIWLISKEAAQR